MYGRIIDAKNESAMTTTMMIAMTRVTFLFMLSPP
jgi:hypothetical protein